MIIIKTGLGWICRKRLGWAYRVGPVRCSQQLAGGAALILWLGSGPSSVLAAELSSTGDATSTAKSRWVTAGWISWHFRNADERNAFNLGIGLEIDANQKWTIAGGAYNNSFYENSIYTGVIRHFWVRDTWRLGLMLGAVNGYRHLNDGRFYPYVFPMLQYLGRTLGANLSFIPPVDKTTGGLLAVQLKVPF